MEGNNHTLLTKPKLLGILASAILLIAVFSPIASVEALSLTLSGPKTVKQSVGPVKPVAFVLIAKLTRGEVFFLTKVVISLDGGSKIEIDRNGNMISMDPPFLTGRCKITRLLDGYATGPSSSLCLVFLNANALTPGTHSIKAEIVRDVGPFSTERMFTIVPA